MRPSEPGSLAYFDMVGSVRYLTSIQMNPAGCGKAWRHSWEGALKHVEEPPGTRQHAARVDIIDGA